MLRIKLSVLLLFAFNQQDFTGSELSINQVLPEMKGGGKSELNIVNGISGEKFNMANVLSYRDNKVVYSRERPWSNYRISKTGSPGSYSNGTGTSHADPNCPASQVIHDTGGDYCGFNTANYSTELPALQQLSLLSEANYELSSKVKLLACIGGTARRVLWS